MKNRLKNYLLLIVLFVSAFSMSIEAKDKKAASESMGWGHCATISPLKKAPTLDGKLEPGEWEYATGTINFMNTFGTLKPEFNGMLMDPREGKTLVGYRDNTLYIAIVSALPPRAVYPEGKHSLAKARDAELIGDFNAVEIWLDPNRDRRETRKGDQAFYQIFVNTLGSIYDARLNPGEAPDKGWNTDIRSGNSIDEIKKVWTTEIAIDMSGLGWKASDVVGKSMGILLARNYKAPWNQPTWFPHGDAFTAWYRYPRIYFSKDAIVSRIESLGDQFWDAKPTFKVKLMNPGAERSVVVNLHVKSSDMPDVKDEKTISVPANGNAEYVYAIQGERLHVQADHLFNINVKPVDSQKSTFNYTGIWSHDPRTVKGSGAGARAVRWSEVFPLDQKWSFRAEAKPEASIKVSAYPYYNIIQASLDASLLVKDPGGADKDKLSSSAVVTISRDGKELVRKELSWDLSKKQYGVKQDFKLKELAEGVYEISVKYNKHDKPITKTYKREKYPWEGNKIGITDKIYPPFEAVKADHTSTKVVCREYGVGDLGLWNSVKSLGDEILAGPIVLKADGNRILKGKAKLTKGNLQSATYEATGSDDAVTVKSIATTEIDGCMKFQLELLPGKGKKELKSLTLDIPLKEKYVPLWHAVTTALRVNPMGYLPEGEGVIWDSNKFPNGDWIGSYVPYIWMGGVERGMCVFGDNDKGWVLNWDKQKKFTPCQEFIREGDTIIIRLNLVQKPIIIEKPRTITIGLMATPGKPIPYTDWRGILAWGSNLGKGFDYLPKHSFDMGWAVETTFSAAYPFNRDYTFYEAAGRIPGTPGGDMVIEKGWGAFIKDWKKRNGLDKPNEQLTDAEKRAVAGARSGFDRYKIYNANYWDEYHHDFHGHPECGVFNGEWNGNNMAQSRHDFRCYYAAETVKRGIGLYFDNAYPHISKNLINSEAYEFPGFGIQPSSGIWEQRDYHRRIWNIHREFGAKFNNKPMQMIHMTNTNVIPFLTWNDMNVDLEWFYGPEPQQSKYGLPMMQAETSARQSGCVPYALARIMNCKTPEEQRTAERTKFGAMMVHEVRIDLNQEEIRKLARILYGFGYALSGVLDSPEVGDTVYNYWDDDYPVKTSNDLVKTLLVKRGEELLLLICSWDKDPQNATFTFDTNALGLNLFEAWDAEGSKAEQLAQFEKDVKQLRENLAKYQKELEDRKEKVAQKKLPASWLKSSERNAGIAENALNSKLALKGNIEKTASLPISFDKQNHKLSVGLEGYGVRMIRLK